MGNVFITADHHFGHANIIEHCNRPFVNVNEMNDILVERWNKRVQPGDEVWHLGDFAWDGQALVYRRRLQGNIHLILGNHDQEKMNVRDRCFADTHQLFELKTAGMRFMLCHYPLLTWVGKPRDAAMLHGHCHGFAEPWKAEHMPGQLLFDMGVDLWDFYPVAIEEVTEAIQRRRKPIPGHIFGDEPL